MARLKLTMGCWEYDRTRPLMDATVRAGGAEFDILCVAWARAVPALWA